MTAQVSDSERELPAPHHYPENESFWAAANDGTLLLKHCRTCQRTHWYPREICPFCGSGDTEWRPSSGLGSVYSVSVSQARSAPAVALAYVTLDEGVTLLTNVVGADLGAIAIGDRVRLVYQRAVDGQAIAMFTPAAPA